MSKKSEAAAMKAFPVDKVPYYGLACGAVSERDANLDKRCIFEMGYEQAEKDLALTVDDIEKVLNLTHTIANRAWFHDERLVGQKLYEKVLETFNEYREAKK